MYKQLYIFTIIYKVNCSIKVISNGKINIQLVCYSYFTAQSCLNLNYGIVKHLNLFRVLMSQVSHFALF